jgi:thiol-disulfide isomerase/thioredoxin
MNTTINSKMYFNIPDSLYLNRLITVDSTLSTDDKKIISLFLRKNYSFYIKTIVEAYKKSFQTDSFTFTISTKEKNAYRTIVTRIKDKDSTFTKEQLIALDSAAIVLDGISDLKQRFWVSKICPQEIADSTIKKAFKILDTLRNNEFFKSVYLFHRLSENIEHIDTTNIRIYKAKISKQPFDSIYKEHIIKIADEIIEKTQKPLSIDCNIVDMPKGSGDELLAQLAQKYKEKVLYIDIWATWCGPCISEIKQSVHLKETMQNKDVVFVYLCGRSERQAWENTIKTIGIKGEHYFLTPKQYDDIAAKFQVNGIPHFVIIDKTGKVADSNASSPMIKEVIVKDLNRYLAQ